MKNYGGDSKAFILVNKRDRHSVDIPIRNLKELYSIEGEVHAFSIGDDKEELENFRNEVAGYIKNNPSWNKQKIPTNYYRVKDELENLFVKGEGVKGREHITKDEFNIIAKKHDVENIDKLLSDLHALGVSLWYKDMEEFDTLILNPEWISDGVYKIINWVNEAKKHSLTLADFSSVFKKDLSRYPADKHIYLFKLMKYYELAYELNKGKDLIIPHLLKEDRPEELPDFLIGESLMLRYRSEQPLPPNTISRFIVRHNHEIKKKEKDYFVWRYGVVLEDGKGSLALVREEDRTISVSVNGKNKTDYISTLRETLNDIFNNYKSEKPELQYRVKRYGPIPDEVETKNPLWLTDTKIFNHCNDGMPYYEDVTKHSIDLGNTVHKYNITTENLMLGGVGNQLIGGDLTQNTFNFYKCNIELQGKLNELAQCLTEGSNKEEAKELVNLAKALEKAEKDESKDEVKKKGIANRLKSLVADLGDENSTLHKAVKGIKNGVSIAKDIAKGYNDIAQWLG
ncbi:MAG: COR domain-containing protein [Candidatus Anammoxibacter sp.]